MGGDRSAGTYTGGDFGAPPATGFGDSPSGFPATSAFTSGATTTAAAVAESPLQSRERPESVPATTPTSATTPSASIGGVSSKPERELSQKDKGDKGDKDGPMPKRSRARVKPAETPVSASLVDGLVSWVGRYLSFSGARRLICGSCLVVREG